MNRLYLGVGIALALAIAALVAVLAVRGYGDRRYAAGMAAGRNAVLADDARATEQLRANHEALASFSAFRGGELFAQLDRTLPTIEDRSHATQETIRTIYRDRPVPVDLCSRPPGVQQQLDQAVDRANAAAAAAAGHL